MNFKAPMWSMGIVGTFSLLGGMFEVNTTDLHHKVVPMSILGYFKLYECVSVVAGCSRGMN